MKIPFFLPVGSNGDGTGATIHLTEGNKNYIRGCNIVKPVHFSYQQAF
jgi:hypothetical protein